MVPGLPMIGRRFCSLCSRRIQTAQQQRPRDQLTTARKQLVLALRDAAGEHRPAHLPKHNGAGTASMRCPISLLIGRPTFLWSRGGPELKPFFFLLAGKHQIYNYNHHTTFTPSHHHRAIYGKEPCRKIEIRPKCPTRTSPPPGPSPTPP